MRLGAVAAHFGRDLDRALAKVEGIITDARRSGVELLVLPDATLGGYLSDLRHPDPDSLPPGLARHRVTGARVDEGSLQVRFEEGAS